MLCRLGVVITEMPQYTPYLNGVMAVKRHFLEKNICKEENVNQIALSGGTFINRILLKEVVSGLHKCGRDVYINEKVPCGDGGIALGQMYLMTFEN